MEFGALFVLVGIAIAVFLKRDAKQALIKEAQREASHMGIAAIDIELERLNEEWRSSVCCLRKRRR